MVSKTDIKHQVIGDFGVRVDFEDIEHIGLNVNRVSFVKDGFNIVAGYSYYTCVKLAINGVNFVTDTWFSNSTAKHKGQLGGGQELYSNVFADLISLIRKEKVEFDKDIMFTVIKLCQIRGMNIIRTHNIDTEKIGFITSAEFEGANNRTVREFVNGLAWNNEVEFKIVDSNNKVLEFESFKQATKKGYRGFVSHYEVTNTEKEEFKGKVYKNLSLLNNSDLIYALGITDIYYKIL